MRVFIILSLLLALLCPATAATPQKPDSALIQRIEALQASVQRLNHQVDSLMIFKTQQEKLLDATNNTLDRSIAIQNTAATWVEILVGLIGSLLLLFGAAVSFVWFRERKLLTEAKQIVTDIERLREDARKRVDEFKAEIPNIQAFLPVSDAEKARILEKVEGFEQRLAAYEATGGKLTAEDHEKRAVSYVLTGRFAEALAEINSALELNPKSTSALNTKGAALAALGRHEEAIQAFDAALKIEPDDCDVIGNKGYSFAMLGRHEEALQICDTALKIKSDDYVTLSNKGYSLAALGRYDESIQAFDASLRVKPDYDRPLLHKARVFAKLGKKQEMLDSLRKAVDLNPSNRKDARTNADFKDFWGDDNFKALVGE